MTSLITGTPLLLAGSSAASQPPISIAPGGGGSPFGFLPEHPLCSAGPRPHLCRRSPGLPPVQHLDPERARSTQSQLGLSENGVNVK